MLGDLVTTHALKTEKYRIIQPPYYASQGDDKTLFEAAFANRLPVLLKGLTGCGKMRFMERMTWRLKRSLASDPKMLATVNESGASLFWTQPQ